LVAGSAGAQAGGRKQQLGSRTVHLLQPCSPQIPMPCRYSDSRPWVFQRLALQPLRAQLQSAAEREQSLPVRAHEMHHRLAPHPVPVKPDAAVEGEAHPLTAACELTVGRLYWQVTRPSAVAGGTGGAAPENSAHVRPGAYRLVVVADQPPATALMLRVTPAEGCKLFIRAGLAV